MADENVTASENTNETTEQATTPAVKASKPAVPSPASMKPHAPSPAAFAKKAPQHTAPAAASTGFSDADVKTAEAFGRVADDGTVFVKDGEGEREVGQFPDASKEEALALYARRYLDLKAKLDLFANKLKSNNVKSREIDETIKTLSAETEQPAVVGDLAALKAQFEALKEEGAAKKTALTEARKAAIAKAVEERTAIVEKAEALADSLDEDTNWRSTADKFRSLFQQWQDHQHNSVRLDKADADALWSRFSSARTTFNSARRKWAQGRDEERSNAKAAKEAAEGMADFRIRGYYAAAEALTAAVTEPEAGDAYGVGADAPYDIYVWDGVGSRWVNNGPLFGVRGKAMILQSSTEGSDKRFKITVDDSGTLSAAEITE